MMCGGYDGLSLNFVFSTSCHCAVGSDERNQQAARLYGLAACEEAAVATSGRTWSMERCHRWASVRGS